jgi:hypothetical protein
MCAPLCLTKVTDKVIDGHSRGRSGGVVLRSSERLGYYRAPSGGKTISEHVRSRRKATRLGSGIL